MLSIDASSASKYLLKDPCSLFAQSSVDREKLQGDGWGIGFYADGASCLIKSEKPVYEEQERFTSDVRHAKSKIILAHIRRASNPRGLPREKIVSLENSQPFKHENFLFTHNGVITIPDEVAESLGKWKQRIRGFNDSEVYFWYIAKEVANGTSFPEALRNFERNLSELWRKNREKHPHTGRPYAGLNALVSDGEKLYAYCKYHEQDRSARSLCLGDQPVFQMSYLVSPARLVVVSEKTNREDDWKPLESGQLLTGQIRRKKIDIELQEIK
jgi:predicted glutamine amidotransferase